MDESILFPSPNWFQVSGLAVTNDGWIVYGGPSKSLCVLEPLDAKFNPVVNGQQSYQAHVINRSHAEKILSVDTSPEWPDKKFILTGGADGSVKLWSVENLNNSIKIKSTQSHDVHIQEKEELAGVGFSTATNAITVGVFGNVVKWDVNSNVVKTYNQLLKGFRPVCISCSQHIALNVAVGTKQGVVFLLDLNGAGKIIYKVRGHDDEIVSLSWCPQYNVNVKKVLTENKSVATQRLEKIRQLTDEEKASMNEDLDQSGTIKNLPDDSFDNSAVEQEDDVFDIYKDHESDEFGHKKFEPREVVVKVKAESVQEDNYLEECMKLKEKILKMKDESSIESLVDALDKTHVDTEGTKDSTVDKTIEHNENVDTISKNQIESSDHTHKHLLSSVSKYGGVRIWSKTGKLVANCVVSHSGNKNQRHKLPNYATLLWYKADVLLIADGKSQLLECNPLQINCKNKLDWQVVHTHHKRGLYCIATDAPRVQSEDVTSQAGDWSVWTASQERTLVQYAMKERKHKATYSTCGGYIYNLQTCPYDAKRVAASVGDGAVRIWECDTLQDDDTKLSPGQTNSYWQNVQGKVLTVAWHPVKENLLAFSTAESRVGLIDCSGKTVKPARVLMPALRGGVYSLYWGEGSELYACGDGDLVVYNADKTDAAPEPIKVEVDGQARQVSTARRYKDLLVCGTNCGGVVVISAKSHQFIAATHIYTKMIHEVLWHPQETSSSNEESQFRNLIAVCSLDKQNTIVILEYADKEGGGKQLFSWKVLSGHKAAVLQLAWSPHNSGQLLSTSQDCTVRVWDISTGSCTAIFGNHTQSALTAVWCAFPQLSSKVLSGGGDCCLRLWDINDHPPEAYDATKHETTKKDKKKNKEKKAEQKKDKDADSDTQEQVAASSENKIKASKKFLLPITYKQITQIKIKTVQEMLNRYLEAKDEVEQAVNGNPETIEQNFETNFLKLFGNINEVNEVLEIELQRHLDNNNVEAWIMLSIFRGHIDAVMQWASQHDLLCPFLVSIAPCVSFKYWKDVTQLYLAQIDRLTAKKEEDKLIENRPFGGTVYRKAATLLSIHDIKGAVGTLLEARLFKEAYVLCRTRYMDSIAEDILKQWADHCALTGTLPMATVCYIALGNIAQAATVLGKSNDQEFLILAANIAKTAGQNTFANHIVEKQAQIKNKEEQKVEEMLKELPSKMELLLKGTEVQSTEESKASET